MSKKSRARLEESSAPSSSPWGRWAVTGVLVLGLAGAAVLIGRKVLAGEPVPPPPGGLRTLPAGFDTTKPKAVKPSGPVPDGMVWIPGGAFSMGSDDPTTSVCGGGDAMPD